jgi:predicted ArsR family transcriptional regulator
LPCKAGASMSAKAENFADIVASIAHAPRTIRDLQEMTGMHQQTVRRVLHALKARGVVDCRNGTRKAGQDGQVPFEWLWVGKQ